MKGERVRSGSLAHLKRGSCRCSEQQCVCFSPTHTRRWHHDRLHLCGVYLCSDAGAEPLPESPPRAPCWGDKVNQHIVIPEKAVFPMINMFLKMFFSAAVFLCFLILFLQQHFIHRQTLWITVKMTWLGCNRPDWFSFRSTLSEGLEYCRRVQRPDGSWEGWVSQHVWSLSDIQPDRLVNLVCFLFFFQLLRH